MKKYNIIYKIDKEGIEFIHIVDGHMQNNNFELDETIELIYQI